MDSFSSYLFRKAYKEVEKLGDKLARIEPLIDWEAFRPIIRDLYDNKTPKGGRPNVDEVVMVKLLMLQQWYGLSDPELERQATDRISFRRFLGYPDRVPDSTTMWLFRERLADTGRDKAVWEELQRQLDEKGLSVKKGVVQDASFITSDPGHAKKDKPRGGEARTRRSRDGSWAKKGVKSSFGFKLHAKLDVDLGLIRDLETTTASVHDSQVDLSRPGEVVYRDKGYFGVEPRGYSATMRRGVRGRPLGIRDRLRNRRINRKRAPGERPFAVIKRVFGSGHVMVTTVARVRVKMVFACFCFNLVQLGTLAAGS
ncbi:MAG: IS5 family transposase [Arenicellales bacterium]|jgi:IS5 family transposase|nr:IS5 family transposase [Arenicellales bacterium]|tara:strand:+ start:188 stop:1126 length:939 start_codon:yes stop_codon:yes gene_type:complete